MDYRRLLMVPGELDLKLRAAADRGRLETVTSLLYQSANVNSCSEHGVTALHLAVSSGHSDVVAALLHGDAHLDTTNQNGQTALHIAAIRGDLNIVRLLTDAGCDINVTTQYSQMTALHLAGKEGHVEVCRHLLSCGADIDITDQINKPAYYYAANEALRQMLRTGTDRLRKELLSDQYARKVSLDTVSQHNISLSESVVVDDKPELLKQLPPSRKPSTVVFGAPGSGQSRGRKSVAMPPARRPSQGAGAGYGANRGRRASSTPRVLLDSTNKANLKRAASKSPARGLTRRSSSQKNKK